MALTAGTRLGPYEILAPIGAGGMGEVYRALDPRLGREVAIKILPAAFSADPDRLRRFEQEARATGALNHPNILAIYDIGTESGSPYLVSELLEGETLRTRLADGPLSPRKAIDYALGIAHGLAAAHQKKIVHRDLKPANLFITKDGRIKILDFGLAKLTPSRESEQNTASPTQPLDTDPGVVMGTAAYMSPEQVRARNVDHRSDIFSFGAILYEMLTGQRAFQGDSSVETMNAILKEEPPEIAKASRNVPPGLEQIVGHCLEKDPDQRFQGAADLAFALSALSGLSDSGARAAVADSKKSTLRRRLILATALLALGAIVGVAAALWLNRVSVLEPPRLNYLTYSGHDGAPAASPDGRTIAFHSDRDGRRRIWLKDVLKGGEVALTAGGDFGPRFSPDGSMILFTHTGADRPSLYRIALVGGEPRKLVEDAFAGDWSPDGRQIAYVRFATVEGETIASIWIAGGDGEGPREIARSATSFLLMPRWSPDGRFVAAVQMSRSTGLPSSILLVRTDGSSSRTISPAMRGTLISSVAWSGVADEVIYSQAESTDGAGGGGASRMVLQNLRSGVARTLFWSQQSEVLDILGAGRLVFDSSSPSQSLRDVSFSAKSATTPDRWLTRGNSRDREPVYSPDGEWVVFTSNRSGNLDLWAISTKTGTLRRITDDLADDWDPAFTADGKQVVWSSNRSGRFQIWIASADGSGARQVSNDEVGAENPVPTPDGRWILFSSTNPAKGGIWKIRTDGSAPTQFVGKGKNAQNPEVSPNGEYISYYLDGIRRVARVADGAEVPFEIRGAHRLRWMPGGRAIAFIGQNDKGVAGVYVQDFVPGQDTSRSRRPLGGFDSELQTETFGISPDGARMTISGIEQRFNLMIAENVPGVSPPRRIRR